MCVFLGSLCLIFLLRDDSESLKCWLDLLLSCMLDCIHICVFLFLKNGFYVISIPPWHLAICRALKVFSYRNLDRSSIAGGSKEKVPGSSISSRQLVDRLSLFSCVFALFLDTFSTAVLLTLFFSTPTSTNGSTPLSVENYWEAIYLFFAIQFSFLWFLSICSHLFLSQTPSLSLQTSSQVIFSSFFKFSFT